MTVPPCVRNLIENRSKSCEGTPLIVKKLCSPLDWNKQHLFFAFSKQVQAFQSVLESESYSTTSVISKPAKMFAIALWSHLEVT